MAGLGPAIHALRVEGAPRGASRASRRSDPASFGDGLTRPRPKTWMAGTSPTMTPREQLRRASRLAAQPPGSQSYTGSANLAPFEPLAYDGAPSQSHFIVLDPANATRPHGR